MLYRGKVTRATAAGVWVKVDRLVPGVEFGPLQVTVTPLMAHSTGAATAGTAHTHPITRAVPAPTDAVQAGDSVLVGNLGTTSLPDLVVLGRFA